MSSDEVSRAEARLHFYRRHNLGEGAGVNGVLYRENMKEYRKLCDQLTLLDHQEEIYNRFSEQIKSDKKILIDLSELGSGKSYVLMKLAYDNDFTILYISSELAVSTMQELLMKYGIYHVRAFTFTSLTSTSGFVNNPYIYNYGGEFIVTENYKDLLEQSKILVVIDEIQAAKNSDARRSDSIRRLLNPVYFPEKHGYSDTGAKVCLLSGTLFDKKKHACQMIYLTNFCGSTDYTSKLYYQENGVIVDYMKAGFGEIIYTCTMLDQGLTEEIVGRIKYSRKGIPLMIENSFSEASCIEMVYLLFIHIVLPYYSDAISKPQCSYKKHGKNIYTSLTKEQRKLFLRTISEPVYVIDESGSVRCKGRNPSRSRFILMNMIHDFKAQQLVKVVMSEVKKGMKCVIYTEYDTSTEIICNYLTSRNCNYVRICGDTKSNIRYDNINAFNNDPKVKVIVCKKAIASASINLHCKKPLDQGGEERSLHIIPGYDLTLNLQGVDRVDRVERATEVHINVWWCRSGITSLDWLERDLLQNLEEKISVVKEVSRLVELGISREFFTDYEEYEYDP